MSKNPEGKSQRSFVIEDATWYAALAAAKASETTVSAVIRDALIAFVEANPATAATVKKVAATSRAKGVVSEAAKPAEPTAKKAPAVRKPATAKAAAPAAKAPTDRQLAVAHDKATAAKAAKLAKTVKA